MKPKIFELDENCHICGTDRWPALSMRVCGQRYMLLVGCSPNKIGTIKDKGSDYVTSVTIKDKSICLKCFEILVGLENHYDSSYTNLMENPEAVNIVKKIGADENILKEASEYIDKGKYLPDSIVTMAKK